MYIDFHTHIFPDKVAAKAIPKLAGLVHLEPSTNGTAQGLLDSMEQAGIKLSITLPAVTDPHQFESILRFAHSINEADYRGGPRLLSFAGIHPDCSDINEKLNIIKYYGFKGIKLHPDYQQTCFNDIRFKRLLYKASELDLICLTHTGMDPYSPDKVHCTPQMILEVLKEVAPKKLVLAHMGSNENYDQAEAMLMGQDVYLDTAYSILHMNPDQLVRMIRAHGTDKILFASDAPWSVQKEDIRVLESLPLTDEEKQAIGFKNAEKLLEL